MAEKHMPVSEARQQLPGLCKQAGSRMTRYIITQHGQPQAVMLGYKDYLSMKAAVELLQRPELVADIETGLAQLRRGERLSQEEAERRLQELKQAAEATNPPARVAEHPLAEVSRNLQVNTQNPVWMGVMCGDLSSKCEIPLPGIGVWRFEPDTRRRKRPSPTGTGPFAARKSK